MENNIKLYSKDGCGMCRVVKMWLDKNGFEGKYEDINVSNDEKSLSYIKDKGFSQLPVVEIGDSIFSGFQEDVMEDLLLNK